MTILEYSFIEERGLLNVYFTMTQDDEDVDRSLTFNLWDIEYYLPTISSVDDLSHITEDMVHELVAQYLKENEFLEEDEI